MNGENGYAGALFFALMSLGALLKLEDSVGWIVGAGCALFAAIFLRAALSKSAQTVEEDHQRMEIQFQQLRNKVGEAAAVSAQAVTSTNDAARLVQENLEVIRVRLAELDNLTVLAENSSALKSELKKNSFKLNSELEKISSTLNSEPENFEQLNANLQTISKLLQLVAQLIKNQSARDFEEINSSIILIDDEKK